MVWMGEGVGYFMERERRGDLDNNDNDAYKIWVLVTLAEVDF